MIAHPGGNTCLSPNEIQQGIAMKTRTRRGQDNPVEEQDVTAQEPQAPETETEETPVIMEAQEAGGEAETRETETMAMAAIGAIQEGVADATAAAAEAVPALGRLLSKSVYGAFYYGSYGVVFGTLTIAHLVPTNNIIGEGLRDGAKAARVAFSKRSESKAQAEQEVVLTSEEVSSAVSA
jgi:hypothetical protein